MVISLN